MKCLVLAVGRMKAGPERELLRRYIDRAETLARAAGLEAVALVELDESRARTAAQRRRDEATALRDRIPTGAMIVMVDERGQMLDSAAFASLIRRAREASEPALAFVIGGPDGLDQAWREAQRSIAFGAMTVPHQLVRVLLAEQIYRSFTILVGHPYHRA